MGSKLLKYAKQSSLNNIKIKVGEESLNFNLFKELGIDDEQLDSDLMDNARIYGYLSIVYNRLTEKQKLLELEHDQLKGDIYNKLSKEINPTTNRAFSKDAIELQLVKDKTYAKQEIDLIRLKTQVSDIKACIAAFEQRKDLLQTASANRRAENK